MRPQTIGLPIISGYDDPFGWNGDLDITVGYRVDLVRRLGSLLLWRHRRRCERCGRLRRYPRKFHDCDGAARFSPRSGIRTADDRTDLHSLELNQRHTVTDNVTFLSGFRYLEIDEDLQFGLSILERVVMYAWSDTIPLIWWANRHRPVAVAQWSAQSQFGLQGWPVWPEEKRSASPIRDCRATGGAAEAARWRRSGLAAKRANPIPDWRPSLQQS